MKKFLNFDNIFATISVVLFVGIVAFISFYSENDCSFCVQLFFITTLFTIIMYLLNKYRFKNFSDFQKCALYAIITPMLIVALAASFVFLSDKIKFDNDKDMPFIVSTQNIDIVKNIDKDFHRIFFEVKFDQNGNPIYAAMEFDDYLLLDCVKKYLNNNDIMFYLSVSSYSNKKTTEYNMENIILKLKEVSDVKVKFYNSKKEIKELKDTSNLTFIIDVEIYNEKDKQEVEKIINKLLPKFAKRTINITVKEKNIYKIF